MSELEDLHEEALFDLSDEELEAAVKESKIDALSPEVGDEPEVEEEIDEIEEEDTEQPEDEQDSDDNEGEDSEAEEEEGEDSEEEEDEQSEPEEEKKADEPKEVRKRKYKANGQEFEFTEEEIFEQFGKVFGQAMDYTKKMQAIAPYRGMIATLKEQNLTQDDLNLAIDVLKGDRDAIAEVLKRKGIDALDLDVNAEQKYQPNDYGRSEAELAIQEIVEDIGRDPEYQITHGVIEHQWDDGSKELMMKHPALIKGLHVDIKNGTFDKVSPVALKLKVLDGGRKSDLEYYLQAGSQLQAEGATEAKPAVVEEDTQAKAVAQVKEQEAKRQKARSEARKRKAAAPTKSRAGKKDVMDYLDDSDEAFEEWYKQLEDKF